MRMRLGIFYVGTTTIAESFASIADASFSPRGFAAADPSWAAGITALSRAVAEPALLVLVLLAAIPLVRSARAWTRRAPAKGAAPESTCSSGLLLVGGTLLMTLGFALGARWLAGVRYPEARMGLYWPPLICASSLCLARNATRRRELRALLAVPVVGAGLWVLASYLACIDATMYGTWAYDRSSKRYVEEIVRRHESTPGQPCAVGMTWLAEPAFNFYRIRFGLDWLMPATRKGPVGDYDYYVLLGQDRELVRHLGLVEIARDDVAGSILAQPAGAAACGRRIEPGRS
jgi:hypothetical protein